jgi:hypothetical protein
MNHRHLLAIGAVALAAAAITAPARAAVSAPDSVSSAGDLTNLGYGSTGNVFDLHPYLYVQGLGSADAPPSVVALNPALSVHFTLAGTGTGLTTATWDIHNGGAAAFDNLRFWVVVNPDGDQFNFLDQVSENWAATTTNGPVAREVQAFDFNPFNTIANRAVVNAGLTSGAPSGDCASALGTDCVFALQWNAAHLLGGQDFVVRVGLSDNGKSLSNRSLTAQSIDNLNTALTFSGVATVATIPEPTSGMMLLAGFAGMAGIVARRRRADVARG